MDQARPQRRLAPSERLEFTVGANSPTGEPIADAAYKAEIILPDGARRPLALVRQDEQMAGSFHDTQLAGDYAVEVTATLKDQPLGTARARFLVFRQDLELDNASADAPMLGESRRHDRRAVAGPRAIARADQTPDPGNATPRSAARDEENLLGHVDVFLDRRRPARAGMVSCGSGGGWCRGEGGWKSGETTLTLRGGTSVAAIR